MLLQTYIKLYKHTLNAIKRRMKVTIQVYAF